MLTSLSMLAQASSDNQAAGAVVAGVGIAVILVMIVVGLAIGALIAYVQYKALVSLPEASRKCNPVFPWLVLIPLAGIVFMIICYLQVPASFVGHFGAEDQEAKSAKTMGIVCLVLLCCSIIPFLGILAALGYLVCFIIYLVKIHALGKRALATA